MNKCAIVLGLAIALTLSYAPGAMADTFNEKVVALKLRINCESNAEHITGNDRRELQKMIQDVSEHKRQLMAKNHDILSAEDDETLSQELNGVSQRLDEMIDAKIASKPKAKDEKAQEKQ